MTDHEIDTLVAGANPVADRDLRALDVGAGEAELADGVARAARAQARHAARTRPPRRRRYTTLALALTAAAAILAVVALGDRGAASPETAWAAPLVRLAESSPLLLLSDDWTVTRADEQDRTTGEMTLVSGKRHADLYWRPGKLATWQRDRALGAAQVVRRTVLGHPAQLAQYRGSDGEGIADFTAIWPDDGRVLEVRANTPDLAAFEALLATLRRVDVDAWLSAMPASVVKAANRGGVVDEMLKGVPLPPGFDRKRLQDQQLTSDRYQLGARVTAAVGCAWIDRWDAARKAGDTATAAAAATAMATSHDWPILKEMEGQGGWTGVFWDFADAMRKGDGTWYGRPLKGDVQEGLGCDG
jgi:hypothetical protein